MQMKLEIIFAFYEKILNNQYSIINVQLLLPWHSPQACLALQLERAGQVC